MLSSEIPSEKALRGIAPWSESPAERFESNTCHQQDQQALIRPSVVKFNQHIDVSPG
jgi:hypothetical protein